MCADTVRRFSEQQRSTAERTASIKPVLSFFINQYTHIVPHRLQKLVFYADAIHYRDHDEQLTDARWGPYMYGMYSEDVAQALEDYKDNTAVTTRNTLYNGTRTTAYVDAPDTDLSQETREFLETIHEETQDIPTSELMDWTKNHPLFDETPYGEYVEFN